MLEFLYFHFSLVVSLDESILVNSLLLLLSSLKVYTLLPPFTVTFTLVRSCDDILEYTNHQQKCRFVQLSHNSNAG